MFHRKDHFIIMTLIFATTTILQLESQRDKM